MPAVEWSDDLSVGIEVLDGHHKRLIALLNDLAEVVRRQDAQEVVGRTLGELIRYTYYHFGEEERLMEEAGYDDLDAHRQSHRIIADHVRGMEAEWDANPRTVVAAELFEFLSDWLIHHIRVEDARYTPILAGGTP
ncbi:MAG TPA: bacteriohemerythrin [Candidatus Omnitrophota bacterium]|nr:bacteriohemerythrin [Candidatus Omnitrophota bacterium]